MANASTDCRAAAALAGESRRLARNSKLREASSAMSFANPKKLSVAISLHRHVMRCLMMSKLKET